MTINEKNNLPLEYSYMDWTFKSKSNPRTEYLVTVDRKNGYLGCDCPGFTFRHDCWHVRRVRELRSQTFKGYKYVQDDVVETKRYGRVIVYPFIELGRPESLHKLATVVFDLLNLGVEFGVVRKLLRIVPPDWTEKAVEEYITKKGRYI